MNQTKKVNQLLWCKFRTSVRDGIRKPAELVSRSLALHDLQLHILVGAQSI
jgi:hypothetical protein